MVSSFTCGALLVLVLVVLVVLLYSTSYYSTVLLLVELIDCLDWLKNFTIFIGALVQ